MASRAADDFRLTVLNPGGRDPEQHFRDGAGPVEQEHPPLRINANHDVDREVTAVGRDGVVGRAIDVQGAAWRKIKDRNEPVFLEVGANLLCGLLLIKGGPVLSGCVRLNPPERLAIEFFRPQRIARR